MGEKLRTKKQEKSPRRCRRRRKEEAEGGGRQTDDGTCDGITERWGDSDNSKCLNHQYIGLEFYLKLGAARR